MDDVVIVSLDGEYAGWHATFRSVKRVSARTLVELESEHPSRRLVAYSKLILSVEGWRDPDGNPITDPLDAPIGALDAAATAYFAKATELPNG